MKSVSKLILRALSSRALPFFVFKPTDLKRSWCLLLGQRQKPCNFLCKPPEASKQHPLRESCFNTLTFHNAPKSQGSDMSPTTQASFWDTFQDIFLSKCLMQVNKGSEDENTWGVQLSLEEHWSVLRNPQRAAAWCEELPWGICDTKEREAWALDSELVSHEHCLQKGRAQIQVALTSPRRDLGEWCPCLSSMSDLF